MSDHNMEPKIKELMELKRMKEELEAEIADMEKRLASLKSQRDALIHQNR